MGFKGHRYLGDPINAVKIFNDLKADELVFLDISATIENRLISLDFVRDVGDEANMPFAVGGGIKSIQDIRDILNAGAEKVVINSAAFIQPDFIRLASDTFGSSTIVVCIDVKKQFFGKEQSWILNGNKSTGLTPIELAERMEKAGAGEIIIQSIERDGMMQGYDIRLIKKISESVTIPVIALGGAGNGEHMKQAYSLGNANALAAGSMFVYHGARKGILINYPDKTELNKLFSE